MCIIHQNRWRITQGAQPERRMSHLEPRTYNKSCPSPKAYCFSKSVDKKSLLVSSPCLASLNSACIFTPTKCAPWFESIIEPCWSSFEQVPYMVMVYLSSHVVLTSHVTSRTILFKLSKETLFRIATIVAPQASPCILPRTLMTLVNQGQSNTQDSTVHFYAMSVWPPDDFVDLSYPMIQESVATTHTKESFPFQLSSCPSCYAVNAHFIVSYAPLPFINLGTRFFKGGGL
jgi:hypothetical protein